MDKVTEEEDFKGLDEEIDDAVDRLFIDNKGGSGKRFSMESPILKTPLKSIENMDAQLLSLEWEITEEKLKKTREEILALRELLKQKPDLASILSDMEKVLNHMIENEENIRPSWIRILLDSKETIKLLTRTETGGEINIYKQLAYLGIEARFSS